MSEIRPIGPRPDPLVPPVKPVRETEPLENPPKHPPNLDKQHNDQDSPEEKLDDQAEKLKKPEEPNENKPKKLDVWV